jgi:hypothetical protein
MTLYLNMIANVAGKHVNVSVIRPAVLHTMQAERKFECPICHQTDVVFKRTMLLANDISWGLQKSLPTTFISIVGQFSPRHTSGSL